MLQSHIVVESDIDVVDCGIPPEYDSSDCAAPDSSSGLDRVRTIHCEIKGKNMPADVTCVMKRIF